VGRAVAHLPGRLLRGVRRFVRVYFCPRFIARSGGAAGVGFGGLLVARGRGAGPRVHAAGGRARLRGEQRVGPRTAALHFQRFSNSVCHNERHRLFYSVLDWNGLVFRSPQLLWHRHCDCERNVNALCLFNGHIKDVSFKQWIFNRSRNGDAAAYL